MMWAGRRGTRRRRRRGFTPGDVIIVGIRKWRWAEQQGDVSIFVIRANLPRGLAERPICLVKVVQGWDLHSRRAWGKTREEDKGQEIKRTRHLDKESKKDRIVIVCVCSTDTVDIIQSAVILAILWYNRHNCTIVYGKFKKNEKRSFSLRLL